MSAILIAILGGQPQVVTFTLDLLLQRGIHIDEVYTVFPGGNSRYVESHRKLEKEFSRGIYAKAGIGYRARGLTDAKGQPLLDIHDNTSLDRVWEEVSALIGEAKREGHRLHISLTGGRRAIALMLFSAAMLYCTPSDRVWHIYTPPHLLNQVKDGAQLHVDPNEGGRLLEIPFAPWGAYFPGLKTVLGLRPQQVSALRDQWPDEETTQQCSWVWRHLTERQREVLKALVEHSTRQKAADALGIQISTLDSHRATIIEICRTAWPEENVDLRFVRRVFRGFLLEKGI